WERCFRNPVPRKSHCRFVQPTFQIVSCLGTTFAHCKSVVRRTAHEDGCSSAASPPSDPNSHELGGAMNPKQLSAQFAAYVWYLNQKQESVTAQPEAVRFARENWTAFLPCAHEGLGRLL